MKYLLIVIFLSGCSFDVIPPAAKGKILTTAGYMPEILEPGKYTLVGRDQMIFLQTATAMIKEPMSIIMQDKLTLVFDVRFRTRIAGDEKTINAMFNDIAPKDNWVSLADVYSTYGKMVVRNKAREVMSKYSVEDVHKNYARISSEMYKAITEGIAGTPLSVSDVALGNIAYPEVITKAVELAKKRELEIKQAEAQAAIDMTKKNNEKIMAEANYEINIINAKSIRDTNKITAAGITDHLLRWKSLEVQEKMAENKNTVFMPYEAFQSIGAQNRIYATK